MIRYGNSAVRYEKSWGKLPEGVTKSGLLQLEFIVADTYFTNKIAESMNPTIEYVESLVRAVFESASLSDPQVKHLAYHINEAAMEISGPKISVIRGLNRRLEEVAHDAYVARLGVSHKH